MAARLVLLVLSLALVAQPTAADEATCPGWSIHDLGTIRPLGMDFAGAINGRGEIVGSKDSISLVWTGASEVVLRSIRGGELNDAGTIVGVTRRSPTHAASWRDGRMTDLGVLPGGDESEADAINEQGQIAGGSRTRHDDVDYHVVVWRAGVMRDLGPAPGPRRNGVPEIYQLTNGGDVLGTTVTDELTGNGRVITSYPFLWRAGRMISIGGGRRQGTVVGEDARGEVAGTWALPHVREQAFLWRDGTWNHLALPAGCSNSQAVAIDEGGEVLVHCDQADGSGRSRVLVWARGHSTDIGTLFHGGTATALAMNDLGDVVGYADTDNPADSTRHAFVWRRGHLTDLGTLGGDESEANALNDAGDIVGISTTRRGVQHAALWTPRTGRRRNPGPAGC